MSSILDQLRQGARQQFLAGKPARILLPETSDERVIQAANSLHELGLVTPICLSAHKDLNPQIEVFESQTDCEHWRSKAVAELLRLRAAKGMTEAKAQSAIENPLLLATLLIGCGYADGGIAGSIATTADVLRAGIQGIGLAPNARIVSSYFLMELQDKRVVTYADCSVIPDPNSEELAHIAIASSAGHQRLTGATANVALLSFSSKGSAEHPNISKVREAVTIAKSLAPLLNIDGELQFDAAIIPSIGKNKAPNSKVAGQANVFVFPNLDAANIAYKITERLAGATALGPILQGLNKPWMDLSRGCKASDIVDLAAITAMLVDK